MSPGETHRTFRPTDPDIAENPRSRLEDEQTAYPVRSPLSAGDGILTDPIRCPAHLVPKVYRPQSSGVIGVVLAVARGRGACWRPWEANLGSAAYRPSAMTEVCWKFLRVLGVRQAYRISRPVLDLKENVFYWPCCRCRAD